MRKQENGFYDNVELVMEICTKEKMKQENKYM